MGQPYESVQGLLAELKSDAAFEHRHAGLNPAVLREYARKPLLLPPVPAFLIAGEGLFPFLVGGSHRIRVWTDAGWTTVPIHLYHGTREEAFRFSLKENAEHGFNRASADVKKAVADALTYSRQHKLYWNDTVIAEMIDFDRGHISRMHRELRAEEEGTPIKPRRPHAPDAPLGGPIREEEEDCGDPRPVVPVRLDILSLKSAWAEVVRQLVARDRWNPDKTLSEVAKEIARLRA